MKRILLMLLMICLAKLAGAQIPKHISYQGLLTNSAGQPVADAAYSVTFQLYDVSTGGTALWTETQSLSTSKGLFNASLGAVTALNLNFEKPYWLGIAVSGAAEMTPRTAFTASPYSFNSQKSETSQNTLKLQGRNVSGTAPSAGQVLKWTGTDWAPGADLTANGSDAWVKTGDSLYYTSGNVTMGSGTFTVAGMKSVQPASNTGRSFWWIPAKGALRAGEDNSVYAAQVGIGSIGLGNKITASGTYSKALGYDAKATSTHSMALGYGVEASGVLSFALGCNSKSQGFHSMVFGTESRATGDHAIAIGTGSAAAGLGSIAIGSNVKVWADNSIAIGSYISNDNSYTGVMHLGDGIQNFSPEPWRNNMLIARFFGGAYLYTGYNMGVRVLPGGGSWASMSDRSKKENFSDLNGEAVLAKLDKLPVSTWNYKTEDKTTRHAGPMAQDFYKAFELGGLGNDTTITTTDIDGVNMAAIKALIQRTDKLQRENQALQAKVAALQKQTTSTQKVEEQEASAVKALFIVCLLGGVLLLSLVSGRAFSKDTYTSRFAHSRR